MPLQATSGVASYDAYGSAAAGQKVYIESCFSTFLYTGNGSTQDINNGVDLATKGGLVWIKDRSNANGHFLTDTVRGTNSQLRTQSTAAATTLTDVITAFNTSGFSLGNNGNTNGTETQVSWTFAKQPKFFDVVTYTGTGSARTVAHNLGAVPGCMIVKRTDASFPWAVYHRAMSGTPGTSYMRLNATSADLGPNTELWNSTTPTATVFSVGINSDVNANGGTYVAYLFAHDAGGFGDSGTDNVISCGSFTADGSGGATVNLGYEPQYLLFKRASGVGDWYTIDNMRGWSFSSVAALEPNTSDAEDPVAFISNPTATGISFGNGTLVASSTYIYIAIRRGPMRKPTSGASVYSSTANTNNIDSTTSVVMNPAASDLWINQRRDGSAAFWLPRLTGWEYLQSNSTNPEDLTYTWEQRTQTDLRPTTAWMAGNPSQVNHFLRRAPGFFDVVCYTGTGSATTVSHNLGVAPELWIVKRRNATASNWFVGSTLLTSAQYLKLEATDAPESIYAVWNSTYPTSAVLTVSDLANTNTGTYVAYLFATCPGVSKVGSYTGTGATLQIDCGFAAGARFVLIKRTDSTGDWYVWDSARGIVAGNDPHLSLNTTAAEVTTNDSIDPDSSGFVVNQAAATNINVSGASYIYLAIS